MILDNIILPDNSKIIFSCLTGSHLYGTNTKESDVDIRGIFIPQKYYYIGLDKIEISDSSKEDTSYYEIMKFIKLLLDNNPNIIEFLFVPENRWRHRSKEWELIVENRDLFISKLVKYKFLGYASLQLHKIKNHRRWLLDPPLNPPKRTDFGLPEYRSLVSKDKIGAFNLLLAFYLKQIHLYHDLRKQIEDAIENIDYMSIVQKINPINPELTSKILPLDNNILEIYQREQSYIRIKKEWDDYLLWKKNRNPKRALLEEKYGYDTKHALHLIRLIKEGEELLNTGKIIFPLEYREELLEIKNGKYSYEELIELIGNIEEKFQILYNNSKLQNNPNRTKANKLLIGIIENHIRD